MMLWIAQRIVLNDQIVDNELERMWKEEAMADFKVLWVT
jgi:hypothetical protein